jgi:Zn-dependent protease
MKLGQLFSKEELRDIIISLAVITFVFTIPYFNFIWLAFLVVIVAFLFHELVHRYLARKLGCVAKYKMWPTGILFSLLFALFGFKFVAPGAVVIHPYKFGRWGQRVSRLTVNEMGLIALAGPLINIFFALFFMLIPGYFNFISSLGLPKEAIYLQPHVINAWLAFFNLLPIPPLDGSNVVRWKPWLWLFIFAISIALVWVIFV